MSYSELELCIARVAEDRRRVKTARMAEEAARAECLNREVDLARSDRALKECIEREIVLA